MWLNDNAGVLILIFGALALIALGVALWLLFSLRTRFAVQRLKFVGLYSADYETRAPYAALTIGNRSVNEIALQEIGIRNGRVAFDLTALYRKKAGMDERMRIVVEQRHSIGFDLTLAELEGVLVEGKKGRQLRTLRLYAIDLMGNLYQGRIGAVKKLLAAQLAGKISAPASASPAPAPAPLAAAAPAQDVPAEEETIGEDGEIAAAVPLSEEPDMPDMPEAPEAVRVTEEGAEEEKTEG